MRNVLVRIGTSAAIILLQGSAPAPSFRAIVPGPERATAAESASLAQHRQRRRADYDLDELRVMLTSDAAADRALGACRLGDMRSRGTALMSDLVALLSDDTLLTRHPCREDEGRGHGSSDEGCDDEDCWRHTSPGKEAAIALADIGGPAVDVLIDALQHTSAIVRHNGALGLGLLEREDTIEPLAGALQDTETRVRARVAWALGMVESASAVPALATALDDRKAAVREQAAWALGMIESASAVPALASAIADDEAAVREQAAWALGMIESRDAVSALVGALRADPHAGVREQAAWALGMIEDPSAAPALADALEDEDVGVRRQAIWALGMVLEDGDIDIDYAALSDRLRRALRLSQR